MQSKTPSDLPVLWPAFALLPRLAPEQLNGETGSNRADSALCTLNAKNDHQAIQQWLNKYSNKLSTYNSYQKVVEQLLLWSIFQHKKAFSSLTAEDLKIYFEFIKDPQPADAWCGRTGSSYNHWRPFSGPVNSATQHTIRVVLHALMSFLVKGGYLKENPMPHFRLQDRIASDPITKTEINAPILMLDEWEALLKTLDDLPETSFAVKREKYRLRFIIEILFFLKLRVNDLAKYSWNAFYEENNQWWFLAAAKKDLSGPLPVSAELLAGIKNYRLFLGYSPMPTTDDNRPIIQRWQGKNPLRPVHINKMLKSLAIKAANLHFANEPQKYLKLKGFSAHWLRHFSLAMNDVLEVKDGVR